MKNFKVGFALGSGGLCGVAHIGFLEVMEENNIPIDMISGISMGAVVGGLFSSGLSAKEIKEMALQLSKNDIIELNFFKFLKESFLSERKMENYLNKYLAVKNIEDAKIEYCSQAMDILTGDLYTFDKGSFVEAIRASSAIPGIFPPVAKNDTLYIDGGVVESVPYNILKEKGADVVIAVNCLHEYKEKILPKNTIETLIYAMNCMNYNTMKNNKEKHSDGYDLFCDDTTEGVNPLSVDLSPIPKLIESGRKCAEKHLDEIITIIENKKNLKNL